MDIKIEKLISANDTIKHKVSQKEYRMNDLNLIKYAMILDKDVKDMFIVDKEIMAKDYNVRLKCRLSTKHNADQICKDLNELILKYLDGKIGGEKNG